MPNSIRFIFSVILLSANVFAAANEASQYDTTLTTGIAYRLQGNLSLSIDLLDQARKIAKSDNQKMKATGELGATLLQARHLDQANAALQEAHSYFSGVERGRYALDLGNLAIIRKNQKQARSYYEEALQLAGSEKVIHASAGLNLARMETGADKLSKLTALYQEIGQIDQPQSRAPLYLNLGAQAQQAGQPSLALAYQSLDQARQLLAKSDTGRLYVETLDALAQLYEEQNRPNDALLLAQQAAQGAHALSSGAAGELLIRIEGRLGRLYRGQGNDDLALAAYQRAVNQVETLRQDMPVEYEDGRSSFRYTLEPVYLGLTDLLLQQADQQKADDRAAYLRRAIDTVELIKQSELQDYLGDRCTVETVKGGSTAAIPAHTALLYPIVFGERIELLLETSTGIIHKSTAIANSEVRKTATDLAVNLRDGNEGYLPQSKQLYDWIFRPLDEALAEQGINTLVVIPDSTLRLVALGALNDGNRFAIEKFAISTVTGLSMTNTTAPPAQAMKSLIAGASEFGPVVEKLSQAVAGQIFGAEDPTKIASRGLAKSRSMRAIKGFYDVSMQTRSVDDKVSPVDIAAGKEAKTPTPAEEKAARIDALRKSLALPGVADEIEAVGKILTGASMLNASFTVNDFRRDAGSGAYRIVHIASHGLFGGSASTSFILAYDDVLTLDGFQSLLRSDSFHKNPIELLTLSACQTAQGNDRSPLGISGASMKARAKSVLGTLWPVEDNAARKVMEKFYGGMMAAHLSKTEALRQAQIELIHIDEFAHPFYWAPFMLIGNWL